MAGTVVLDANALMMPFQSRMNLDSELERLFGEVICLVPSSVLGELNGLREKHAKAALALARKYEIVETDKRGDDAVIDVAERRSAVVLTNDRELIDRLRELGIGVVRLRSGRHLVRVSEWDGELSAGR
ncbi:MAG: twitching motility protein PilT [Thermoplasmata archaeon]|nr:twitching motility protein PilT [Thermoplasmata archaeon]